MRPFAALLVLLAALTATPAAAQKCDKGSPKKPIAEGPVLHLPGPEGPRAAHRRAVVKLDCYAHGPRLDGLVDAQGKLLVPAIYDEVIPLSPTLAAVRRVVTRGGPDAQASERYRFYAYGKGEQGPVPWPGVAEFVQDGVRHPYAYDIAARRGEFFLFPDGIDKPVHLRDLGGPGWPQGELLARHGALLIANFTSPEGLPLSMVLDLKGEPLSPVLGGIEKWETVRAMSSWDYQQSKFQRGIVVATEFLSVGLTGEHPALPYDRLYVPVGPDGAPMPMPDGVAGVFPLRAEARVHGITGQTFGWALVYDGEGGVRIRWGLGPLAEVMARAATLPVVTGMRRYDDRMTGSNAFIQDVFAIRGAGDGLWRIFGADDLEPRPSDAPASPSGDPRQAYENYVADRMAFQRNAAAEYRRAQELAAQKRAAELEERHKFLIASPNLCNWTPETAQPLAAKTVDHMLRTCTVRTEAFLSFARGAGADPALLDKVEYAFWKERGRYAVEIPYAPPGTFAKPNWEAWGNAMIASARRSTDTFLRDRRREYYGNLERWNTGKQKWCC